MNPRDHRRHDRKTMGEGDREPSNPIDVKQLWASCRVTREYLIEVNVHEQAILPIGPSKNGNSDESWISNPTSSRNSRWRACAWLSPASTFPPGNSQWPGKSRFPSAVLCEKRIWRLRTKTPETTSMRFLIGPTPPSALASRWPCLRAKQSGRSPDPRIAR